jgi:hypothetical protein
MGYLGIKPANSPLTSELIPDGIISTSDIADGAITTAKIGNGAVVPADLSSDVYVARAWVNFNGTGTVAIRASGNVSSITDNNTGDYTVNFTTAFADVNYNAVFGALGQSASGRDVMEQHDSPLRSTTQLRIYTLVSTSGSLADSPVVSVSVFR